MPPSKLLSLPAITAINQIIDGYHDGTHNVGIGIGTHARLDDFFGEAGIAVADEPSIAKKIRATTARMNAIMLGARIQHIEHPRF